MMMMQHPDDNLFQDLLSDYAAPVEDNGFSQTLFENIEAEAKRVDRIRRVSLFGACFVGGVIAASQFPSLVGLISKVKMAVPSVPEASVLPVSTWSLAGIILLGFVLWAALDRKASEIF